MDQTTLTDAAHQVLGYISPLIAAGALAKVGEDATDIDTELLGLVWDSLSRRFQGNRKAEAALILYEDEPQNPSLQQQVIQRIVEVFGQEQAAAQELLALAQAIVSLNLSSPLSGYDPLIDDSVMTSDLYSDLLLGALNLNHSNGSHTPAPAMPALPPRQQVNDPSLSSDGVHFSFGHALIIGVSAYQSERLSVPGGTTATDARALVEVLRDPLAAAYPDQQVRVLVDAKARRISILDALEDLANRVDGGTALIYFAGRGEPVGDSYALLPYDASPDNLAATTISADVFQQRVAKIRARAKRLVVILNCCHTSSGGAAMLSESAETGTGEAPSPAFYRPLAIDNGQVVIVSSQPSQRSSARSKAIPQYTSFGAQLLAALRGKAPGQGASVGIFELFAYLRSHVPADARSTWYRGSPLVQEPIFYASQIDENFPIALRPGWQGATTNDDVLSITRRLVQIELAADAGTLTPAQLDERNTLLARLAQG